MKRKILGAVAAGAIVAAGAGVAAMVSGHAAANAASPGAGPAATTTLPDAFSARRGTGGRQGSFGGGFGFGGKGGFFGGPMLGEAGRILRVTAVNGNTINATPPWSTQSLTITVNSSTTYNETGVTSPSLSQIQPGSFISVRGQRTGQQALTASEVTIVLPSVRGVVTAVGSSSYTVTGGDALPHTVNVSSNTQYLQAGQKTSQPNIVVGTAILAMGTLNSDGSLSATQVNIILPRVAGKVTAVNGNTLTVTDAWGTSRSVVTSSSTTYSSPGNSSATSSSVAVGSFIIAQGTLASDKTTLNAQHIDVIPVGSGRGFFRFGDGGGPGQWGAGPGNPGGSQFGTAGGPQFGNPGGSTAGTNGVPFSGV